MQHLPAHALLRYAHFLIFARDILFGSLFFCCGSPQERMSNQFSCTEFP